MISFLLCLAILIVGYFVYGKIVDNTFGPDDRETPAVRILVYYFIATFISIDEVIGKIYPHLRHCNAGGLPPRNEEGSPEGMTRYIQTYIQMIC